MYHNNINKLYKMVITKTKQWGNSLAVIIPKENVVELRLKPGQEVNIRIEQKSNALKELFGSIKFNKTSEELLKESRKSTSKWD